jgi:agmatine deiminase
MIRNFLYLCLVILSALSCKNDKKTTTASAEKTTFRLPAEFEAQEAVWIAFPNVEHREGFSNQRVVAEIITTLLPYVKVNLIAPSDSALQVFHSKLADSIWKNQNFKTYIAPYQEFWLRDMGPQLLSNAQGEKAMLDLNFNAWGYSDSVSVQKDESLDENIAKQLNIKLLSTSLIHEGGNTEVNGKGTLLVVEAVEKQRNPNMTVAQMEAEFRRTMGVTKIIWLKRGVYEDDFSFDSPINVPNGEKAYTVLTTGGHIDEFCRFADANTILLAEVDASEISRDPVAAENQKRIEENYQILKNATDQDGKPFRILRVPMPPTQVATLTPRDWIYGALSTMNFTDKHIFPKGKNIRGVMASSYLNCLISNKIIIAQKYYDGKNGAIFQARDAAAKNALQTAFPNHKIVMLDARAVNWGGGGIHCITMQQSK